MDAFDLTFPEQLLLLVRSLLRDGHAAAAHAAEDRWADALDAIDQVSATARLMRYQVRQRASRLSADVPY